MGEMQIVMRMGRSLARSKWGVLCVGLVLLVTILYGLGQQFFPHNPFTLSLSILPLAIPIFAMWMLILIVFLRQTFLLLAGLAKRQVNGLAMWLLLSVGIVVGISLVIANPSDDLPTVIINFALGSGAIWTIFGIVGFGMQFG